LSDINAEDYDALILPGVVMNPDNLQVNKDAVSFVSKLIDSGKPIAAICHAPWTLIETGKVKRKKNDKLSYS
jgi:protease I